MDSWQPFCGAESVEEPVRVCVLAPNHSNDRHVDVEGVGFYHTLQVKRDG